MGRPAVTSPQCAVRRAIRSQAGWFGRATSPVPARTWGAGRCAVTVLPSIPTAPSLAEPTALPGLARSIDLLPQGERLRAASALTAPARLAAEPGGEALIVRAVVLLQPHPHRLWHRRAGPRVLRGKSRAAAVRQVKELQNLVVDRAGGGEEVTAVDDQDTVAPEDALQVLKLVGVVTTGPVRIQPVVAAEVTRIGQDALGLAREPDVLKVE